ncbi:MAG: hypothetical protein AAF572_09740 [Cyanobacteria bacterium P01_B01_bin.77]
MSSIDDATLLMLEIFRSFLLSDDLNSAWADLLVDTVTDIIEGEYTDLNVLMYCTMSIRHFRTLLEQNLGQYENTNISATFTLIYISFEDYIENLSQKETRTALAALLKGKSLARMLA